MLSVLMSLVTVLRASGQVPMSVWMMVPQPPAHPVPDLLSPPSFPTSHLLLTGFHLLVNPFHDPHEHEVHICDPLFQRSEELFPADGQVLVRSPPHIVPCLTLLTHQH